MDASDFKESDEYKAINLSAVELPDEFISGGLADADVYKNDEDKEAEEQFLNEQCEEVILPDDETVKVNNVSEKEVLQFFQTPRTQIDGGAKSSVTNLLEVLHDVKWFDNKFKCRVYMRGTTSKKLIIPKAIGKLQVYLNIRSGFLDCDCYYSLDFTSTLFSGADVRRAIHFPREYG